MNLLARKPWLLIVAAFLALIAAWTAFIVVAERHKPVEIPVHKPPRPASLRDPHANRLAAVRPGWNAIFRRH